MTANVFTKKEILKNLADRGCFIDSHTIETFLKKWNVESVFEDEQGNEFYDKNALDLIVNNLFADIQAGFNKKEEEEPKSPNSQTVQEMEKSEDKYIELQVQEIIKENLKQNAQSMNQTENITEQNNIDLKQSETVQNTEKNVQNIENNSELKVENINIIESMPQQNDDNITKSEQEEILNQTQITKETELEQNNSNQENINIENEQCQNAQTDKEDTQQFSSDIQRQEVENKQETVEPTPNITADITNNETVEITSETVNITDNTTDETINKTIETTNETTNNITESTNITLNTVNNTGNNIQDLNLNILNNQNDNTNSQLQNNTPEAQYSKENNQEKNNLKPDIPEASENTENNLSDDSTITNKVNLQGINMPYGMPSVQQIPLSLQIHQMPSIQTYVPFYQTKFEVPTPFASFNEQEIKTPEGAQEAFQMTEQTENNMQIPQDTPLVHPQCPDNSVLLSKPSEVQEETKETEDIQIPKNIIDTVSEEGGTKYGIDEETLNLIAKDMAKKIAQYVGTICLKEAKATVKLAKLEEDAVLREKRIHELEEQNKKLRLLLSESNKNLNSFAPGPFGLYKKVAPPKKIKKEE